MMIFGWFRVWKRPPSSGADLYPKLPDKQPQQNHKTKSPTSVLFRSKFKFGEIKLIGEHRPGVDGR